MSWGSPYLVGAEVSISLSSNTEAIANGPPWTLILLGISKVNDLTTSIQFEYHVDSPLSVDPHNSHSLYIASVPTTLEDPRWQVL